MVYDITDKPSFESVSSWVASIQEHADSNVIKYLLGNKCDKTDERQVSTEEGAQIAATNSMKFFETSAMEDKNITTSIESMVKDIVERQIFREKNGTHLKAKEQSKSEGGCCGKKS